jgi:Zn-dependent M28 family amino/carboxypeptidase
MGKLWELCSGEMFARGGVLFLAMTTGQILANAAPDDGLPRALRADVVALAEEIGPRSISQADSLARAADYIERRLQTAGWAVTRQNYAVGGKTCANLQVERRGVSKPDEIVVIGAHYDTVPQTPGADDNASGVAALLALAERFAKFEPARTLRFVAFANEEPIYFQTELMGSRVYAKACKERGEKIVAMISLESIGYFSDEKKSQKYPAPINLFYPSRGNFLAVVGNRESNALVKRVAKVLKKTNALPIESASLPASIHGIGWSDHWAFWQEGYPAVMLTDTAPFRNPHYHRASDRPDTLDYVRLAAAVNGLETAIRDLLTTDTLRAKK